MIDRIICVILGHQWEKNGVELEESDTTMLLSGFKKIRCHRCGGTRIVKRKNSYISV